MWTSSELCGDAATASILRNSRPTAPPGPAHGGGRRDLVMACTRRPVEPAPQLTTLFGSGSASWSGSGRGSVAAAGRLSGVADEETQEPAQLIGSAALAAGWSHRHRDVSGGWLRPTVFGAVDGLVTNASLIAGLGGGGVSAHTVILTGVAALVAGAFSMGTGEYVSVTNQNELVHAEVATERDHACPLPRRRAGRAGRVLPRLRRRPGDRGPDGRGGIPDPTPRCACTPARSSASTRSSCRRPWSRASRR